MQKKSLEITCYVLGAGAFGVFLRWLQDMLAFDENGLAKKSVFHVLVPLFIIAAAVVFIRFVDMFRAKRYSVPDDFNSALINEGKLFSIFRWASGIIMSLGAVLLLMSCEVDKYAGLLRVLSVLGFLAGISYPLLLGAANKGPRIPAVLCILSMFPILFFAFWLITCYKMNDINSVVWSFSIEIIAIIVSMLAYFRIAGFAFGTPNAGRSMFYCMFGASMCIMTVADARYTGMQLMFFAAAMQMMLYNWILIKNMQQKKAQAEVPLEDGFDRL